MRFWCKNILIQELRYIPIHHNTILDTGIHIITVVTWSGGWYHVEALSVIRWYHLIHKTWYSTPDQVTTVMLFLLYTLYLIFIQKFTHITPKHANDWCYISNIDVISGHYHSFDSVA